MSGAAFGRSNRVQKLFSNRFPKVRHGFFLSSIRVRSKEKSQRRAPPVKAITNYADKVKPNRVCNLWSGRCHIEMKIQVIRRRPFVFSPGGAILAWPVHTGLGIDVYRPMVTGFFICLVSFCFAAAAAAAAAAGRSSLSFRFLCAPQFSLGFTCQSLPNGLVTGYFFTGFPWGFAGFHSTTRRTSLLLFFVSFRRVSFHLQIGVKDVVIVDRFDPISR